MRPHRSWTAWARRVRGSDRLRSSRFQHGGAGVRGVSSAVALEKGDVVVDVPQELSLTACSNGSQLLFGPQNAEGAPLDERRRLIGLLAAQRRLGASSTFAPYFEHMPSLDSYRASHPLFTSVANIYRFAPLPEVQAVIYLQSVKFQDFQAWQTFAQTKEPDARVKAAEDPHGAAELLGAARGVTFNDYDWAFASLLTRGFVVPPERQQRGDSCMFSMALEPGADDFNTDVSSKQNVRWGFDSKTGDFRVIAVRSVKPGKELLEPYTAVDDNEHLADHWGVDLSGNPHMVQPLGKAECKTLRSNLALIGMKPLAPRNGTLAAGEPACKPPAGETQGDIFCLFLRLAREHCRAVDPVFP